MRLQDASLALASLLFLAAGASAQTEIVSTRVLDAEVIDLDEPFFRTSRGQFDFNVGLLDLSLTHGTPSSVDIDLTVVWEFDLEITNETPDPTSFSYQTPIDLIPVLGDCTPYATSFVNAFTDTVAPGDSGRIVLQEARNYGFAGPTFDTGCSSFWSWPDAQFWTSILDGSDRITQSGGAGVSPGAIQVRVARATVSGTVEVRWTPNPLPSTVVCSGSAFPAVTLEARGGLVVEPSLWLFQAGAPNSTNLLVRADQATSVVPSTGICLQGSIRRIPGSISQGGQPFRLPDVPALIGSTEYFQSWFRTPGGNSATSECIEVVFQ